VEDGAEVVVRCAPTFAGLLAGTAATRPVALPASRDGVLVVCGSYVEQTTIQLERLLEDRPNTLVEADVVALAGHEPALEVERLARELARRLWSERLAILATPRERRAETSSLGAGKRIATNLARVLAALPLHPSVVVAKGGITSALTLQEGIGADEAEVLGPVAAGVSRWSAVWRDGTPVDYLVVPGNVGEEELLRWLVDGIVRESSRADALR
jgi:uncharacterized protein YgbK (DUF1537 family)